MKRELVTTTVESAVSDACSILEELKEELQNWYDNLPEQFQNGSKGEALQEAISTLDDCSEPSVNNDLAEIEIKYMPQKPKRKASRAYRRDDATTILSAAVDALQEVEGMDEAGDLADELEEIVNNAESVEFPGMYS